MSTSRRVQQQPAFILHHRPFRDSSQLLDVLTRDHGKIALVARGSRAAKSRLRGVLRPFLPLRLSWVSRSDLGTLTGAETAGAPAVLRGDALLSAYYVNELLINFLHRHDPQAEIFALYADVLSELGRRADIAAALRGFELDLLSFLGYAVNLEFEADTNDPVARRRNYQYRMEQGPVPVSRTQGELVFSGETLSAINARRFDDVGVLRAAGRLLRAVIAHHLGGKELKSRKVLLDLHRGRIAPGDDRKETSD